MSDTNKLHLELCWKPHPSGMGGERAEVEFPNGYGASILRGGNGSFYTRGGTYEIAVMHHGNVDSTTPITDDVMGYRSPEQAVEILAAIEALPPKQT